RALPPEIPVDEEEVCETLETRNEEISAKLESELERLGAGYVELRRVAWQNFKFNNVAGARSDGWNSRIVFRSDAQARGRRSCAAPFSRSRAGSLFFLVF